MRYPANSKPPLTTSSRTWLRPARTWRRHSGAVPLQTFPRRKLSLCCHAFGVLRYKAITPVVIASSETHGYRGCMNHYDPPVLVSFALTMQRIAQAVSQHGYRWWIGGFVKADKALPLASKMDARYGLSLTTPQRYRAASNGRSVALMWLYPQADSTSLAWLVLRRPGEIDEDGEHWCDAHDHRERITWSGYELLRRPYTSAEKALYARHGNTAGRSYSWTWQMTRDTYQGNQRRIRSGVAAVKKNGSRMRLDQALQSLQNAPGFRAVRTQVLLLRRYTDEQLGRARLPKEKWPVMPPYLRARRSASYPLSALITRVQAGEASWFPPPARGTPSGISTPISR